MLADNGVDRVEWDTEIVKNLWRVVNRGAPYDWKLTSYQINNLRELIEDLPKDLFYVDNATTSRALRKYITKPLRCGDINTRNSIARWIISVWGGIRGNRNSTICDYVEKLKDFDVPAVEKFVLEQRNCGISSWSKLLAFADSDRYAIYDLRTAVALNCALTQCKNSVSFAMPPGRGSTISYAANILRNQRFECGIRGNWLGYKDYMSLLQRFVKIGGPSGPVDVLCAEMVIFANSPKIAAEFISAHKSKNL